MRIVAIACLLNACLFGQAQRLLYPLPADTAVSITRGIVYGKANGKDLAFDLYRPATQDSAAVPVVIFHNGFGADLRSWPIYQDWARAVTSRRLAGITMDASQEYSAADFRALVDYLKSHAADLKIDAERLALWTASANATRGLPLAMDSSNRELRAAVIYYGVGEARKIRQDLPLLYVRTGTDDASQNRAIDALIGRALVENAPWSVVNLGSARHAFDSVDDNPWTRAVIAQTLDFLKSHTAREVSATISAGIPVAETVSAVYREDWDAAIRGFQALVESRPRDYNLRFRFVETLFRAKSYARADQEAQAALKVGDGRLGLLAYYAAAACVREGRLDASMAWIEKLKDIDYGRKRVLDDASFAPLRANARFREIMGL